MSSKGGGGIEAALVSVGVAGALAFAIIFVGVILVIPLSIVAIIFGGWWLYDRHQNSDTVLERKAKERTFALYEEALAHKPPDKIEFGKGVYLRLRPDVPEDVIDTALEASLDMFDVEGWGLEIPPPPAVSNSIEGARYRDHVLKLASLNKRDIDAIQRTIAESLNKALDAVPPTVEGEEWLSQPLSQLVSAETVQAMILPYYGEDVARYFKQLRERLDRNHAAQKQLMPTEYKGEKVVFDYLRDTPLHSVLDARVPINVPRHIRHEHAVITGGCLHPDTPILDPVDGTRYTVQERWRRREFFHVYSRSKDGRIVVAIAHPPTRFTKQPMISLSNGLHSIVVTPKHRVWTGETYATADRLRASGAFRLPTIEEHDLSVLLEDDLYLLRRDAGSQDDCRLSSHLYGQQPLQVADSDQGAFPSQAYAHAYSSRHFDADGWAHEHAHTRPCLSADRLSTQGFVRLGCSTPLTEWRRHAVSNISVSSYPSFPLLIGSSLGKDPENTDLKVGQSAPYSIETCTHFTTWRGEVVTDAVYYDFHVPDFNNYWAAGVFHHNSGHGKTTLLENLILKDIKDTSKPALVVIDSQRALIGKLSKLAHVHNRPLIIIDPKDAPALNPFAFNQERYAKYEHEGKERVRNHTMELFGYLFDSLLGADLTTRQGAMFQYMIQAMLAMPETMGRNATLEDVIHFTEAPEEYARAIDSLPSIAKTFFAGDFLRQRYSETKEQVRYRLHAILGNPSIARLFLAQENKVDFFEELNQGAIILIDTDKGFLGARNSGYLGRIAITLLLQAVLERDASTGPKREVFMYIDEAAEYFDKSIETFLTEARKQSTGVTLAHQHFGQMTTELRASVATNTATKYAGGLSAQDARSAAQDMRSSPDFLMAQERLNFACYIRNVTKTAVSIPVEIGVLEREQQIDEATLKAFRDRNRERLSVQEAPEQKPKDEAPKKKSKLSTDPDEYPSQPS